MMPVAIKTKYYGYIIIAQFKRFVPYNDLNSSNRDFTRTGYTKALQQWDYF